MTAGTVGGEKASLLAKEKALEQVREKDLLQQRAAAGAEARAWTGVPQQPLPSPTLEDTIEWVAIQLERHNISRSCPPETGPAIFAYTNNSVDDFIGLAQIRAEHVNSFTTAYEYKRKVEFHLITGGSGAGKTRMGTEIRRMVGQEAVDCQEKYLWATAQAMHIDFNGSGDPLNSADDHISAECILGLRLAARNIFHCDLIKLQQHLPVQHQHWFTLRDVTTYLATQKRKSLGLGSDAILLQVITVDELQLVSGQSVERLQKNSRGLVNVLIGCLAAWMISGGAERCVCLSVLIGTGLECAKIGLSGYEKTSRQICHLTLSQVSDLMADSIARTNRLTVPQANNVLGHRVMRLQLNLLMGLPGFMDMALDVLHTNLKTGVPQNDGEFRQLAGQVSIGLRDKIRTRVKDDFWALGAEVVFRLLLMSLSGVTVSECSCQTISIASTAHLFFAGVNSAPGSMHTWSKFFPTAAMSGSLGSCEFTVNPLQLARDHRQLFRKHALTGQEESHHAQTLKPCLQCWVHTTTLCTEIVLDLY
ncbi:hypothetical protein WJX82_011660 [Trebouxia sp. C0006]